MTDQLTLHVLTQLNAASITASQAAVLLDRSVRQIRRKLKAYHQRAASSVPHGNRGRKPPNAIPEALVAQVVELAKSDTYSGCNNHHLRDLLAEDEGINLAVSSVRRMRRGAGLASPKKRRPPKHRGRRKRKDQAGMMLQIDGSPHRWFGDDYPSCTLLAAIDDATSEVFALFRNEEDTLGYMQLLRDIIPSRGLPLSLYSDQHTIFRSPKEGKLSLDEQLAGVIPESQFGRAMRQLGIRLIGAHSPQAKGRVENLFGQLQDRLRQELRMHNITTIPDANRFLIGFLRRHNARCQRDPADQEPAWRPAPDKDTRDRISGLQVERTVANDNTVSFGGRSLTIGKAKQSYAGKRVLVCVAPDGPISFWHKDQRIGKGPRLEGELRADPSALAALLPPDEASKPAPAQSAAKPKGRPKPPVVTPAPDHPWRNYGGKARRDL